MVVSAVSLIGAGLVLQFICRGILSKWEYIPDTTSIVIQQDKANRNTSVKHQLAAQIIFSSLVSNISDWCGVDGSSCAGVVSSPLVWVDLQLQPWRTRDGSAGHQGETWNNHSWSPQIISVVLWWRWFSVSPVGAWLWSDSPDCGQ